MISSIDAMLSSVNDVVTKVNATDPEGAGLSYRLVSDTSGGFFDLDPSTGDIRVVKDLKTADFVSAKVTVEVTDGRLATQVVLEIPIASKTSLPARLSVFPPDHLITPVCQIVRLPTCCIN